MMSNPITNNVVNLWLKRTMITVITCVLGSGVYAQTGDNRASAVSKYAQWRDYLDKKQFEKIIAEAGSLQRADSADFTTMYLIGQAYEGLLKYKDAYHSYKVCYTLDSTRTDMLNSLARNASNIGRLSEAQKYYQQVIGFDSVNFYANYQLARLYVTLERYQDGLRNYDRLLEKDPENTAILQAKGDCYSYMDSLYSALECYLSANQTNVENASLAATLINLMLKLNDQMTNELLDSASVICDTALFYNPVHKVLRQKKAMIYYVKGEYPRADSVYTSLLADLDSSYMTLKYCGLSRYYARKWYDAVEILEKAFEVNELDVDVCLSLGASYSKMSRFTEAFDYFDIAEVLLSPSPLYVQMLDVFRAELYCKTGECNKGAELYYTYWTEREKQLSWLPNIELCYRKTNMEDMSDDQRQRYLFIVFLHATEILEKTFPKGTELASQYRYLLSVLRKYDEEMFFRGVESLPMVLPNNKKTTISKEKLKELIGKLSEKSN